MLNARRLSEDKNLCRIVLSVLLTINILCVSHASGQENRLLSATLIGILREDISMKTFKESLAEKARLKALQEAYGNTLLSNEMLDVFLSNSNDSIFRKKKYHQHIESMVNGIWLGDTQSPEYEEMPNEKGGIVLQVTVIGYAQKANKKIAHTHAVILGNTKSNQEQRVFESGDVFYTQYESSEDGFLLLFSEDRDEVKTYLLNTFTSHEKNESNPALAVKAMMPILFPNPESPDFYYNLVFTKDDTIEESKQLIWFIYSKEAISLPLGLKNQNGIRAIDSGEFRAWILKELMRNASIQHDIIPVTIK